MRAATTWREMLEESMIFNKEPEDVINVRCSYIDQIYTKDDVFKKHFQKFIHNPDNYTKYDSKNNKAQSPSGTASHETSHRLE